MAKLYGNEGDAKVKAEKHDRRSARTQRLLGEALIALMRERPYADLTVQDILDRANVGRSTFYAHYWDKEDLLTSEVERMLAVLTRQIPSVPTASPILVPSLGLFRHIRGEYHLYQALTRGGGLDAVLRTLRQRLCADVEQQLRSMGSLPDTAITVTAQSVVGSLLSLLQWWLETEMALSPEELDAYFLQLTPAGPCAAKGIGDAAGPQA
jgi:AcrR family transcriptional regulator